MKTEKIKYLQCKKTRQVMLQNVRWEEYTNRLTDTTAKLNIEMVNICIPCFLNVITKQKPNAVITHLPKDMVDEVKE